MTYHQKSWIFDKSSESELLISLKSKIEMFVKNRTFLSKIGIRNCFQKSIFYVKNTIFVKNSFSCPKSNFCQKSIFLSKIKCMVKRSNLGYKSVFWSKVLFFVDNYSRFWSKIEKFERQKGN